MKVKLTVEVTEGLVLDAGSVAERGEEVIISPPKKTMFNQIWEWLESRPQKRYGVNNWTLGIGATALCLRWGTYFSVLADENKPVDPHAKEGRNVASMISDQEMMRINIEASSNLQQLLERWHVNEERTLDFIHRAYDWLPMPQKRVAANWDTIFMIYKTLELTKNDVSKHTHESFQNVAEHPFRALANTIMNLGYRNGAIETVHAGHTAAYSLRMRRMTLNQSREVIRSTAEHLSAVMGAKPAWQEGLFDLGPWPNRMINLPYVLQYPQRWSLSETSSEITLRKEWE